MRALDDAPETELRASTLLRPFALLRMALAGALMGLANLVPGVSGGTMVLVMGLYEPFVDGVANVTRFCFRKFDILLLGTIGGIALLCIATLAEPTRQLVTEQRSAMYALFVGLTLGGAPLLARLARPFGPTRVVGVVLGFALVAAMAIPQTNEGDAAARKTHATTTSETETFTLEPGYGLDVLAGVLGISAMILPGISGAYMLLLIGRYEMILGAVGMLKTYVSSGGTEGDLTFLHVLVPVALGAIVGLVVVSNVLKWLLRHHEASTSAVLLGVLLGSGVGLWPFESGANHLATAALIAIGICVTGGLARVSAALETRGEPVTQHVVAQTRDP